VSSTQLLPPHHPLRSWDDHACLPEAGTHSFGSYHWPLHVTPCFFIYHFKMGLTSARTSEQKRTSRNAPAAQPNACSPVQPTRRTRPCTLTDVQPNSQRSASPSTDSWARQQPKRIGRKQQCSSAPTSTTGPTSGGCLPWAHSGCPHSRMRIGVCMPALLLAAPCSPYCCLPAPCCCSSVPCCVPASAHPDVPPRTCPPHGDRLRLRDHQRLMKHLQHRGLTATYV
jgi:hypothetical protein